MSIELYKTDDKMRVAKLILELRVPRFGLWSGLTIKIGIRVNCIGEGFLELAWSLFDAECYSGYTQQSNMYDPSRGAII